MIETMRPLCANGSVAATLIDATDSEIARRSVRIDLTRPDFRVVGQRATMERTGKPRHRLQDRRLNESREFINKMSDGHRERAWLEVKKA
jgi:hypothetical protein